MMNKPDDDVEYGLYKEDLIEVEYEVYYPVKPIPDFKNYTFVSEFKPFKQMIVNAVIEGETVVRLVEYMVVMGTALLIPLKYYEKKYSLKRLFANLFTRYFSGKI